MLPSPLDLFSEPVAGWFRESLGRPTRAQILGWPTIARGESTLILAPTGSGKTLAAFLVAIDRLVRADTARRGTRILYVSPLKALAFDIERNLQVPLAGIAAYAARAGAATRPLAVDVRTGDTSPKERARMLRAPGDILITTPESFYLMLTSRRAREGLASIETVIVDEIHALLPSKRGAHLALSMERLEALRGRGQPPLQRIGLSATQRPVDEAARLLGGFEAGAARPVAVVDTGARKELDLLVEPVAPLTEPEEPAPRRSKRVQPASRPSVWPGLHARVSELVHANRSTIVFVNSRRLAERLAAAIRDLADGDPAEAVALAHHGSLAREKRVVIEERLKKGDLRAIVATSSLELGIDMGAVDLVVQVEAPTSVSSGLQRVGRACHGVGGVPRGVLIPKHRQDLIACAVAAGGMRAGDVEDTFYPRNPLDVLAQQIVAMASMETLAQSELLDRVRRAAPFADLPATAFEGILDMLSGHYPTGDFAELRPRITWDRAREEISGRTGAQRLAITNAGTIPDRGLYGVFTVEPGEAPGASDTGRPAAGRRVGELDEEMVFELRVGEVFLLGASSWRAEKITHDRVLVTPAAGQPGKMPFWHGDRPGRARPFGARIGKLVRDVASGRTGSEELRSVHALAPGAADGIASYVREQVEATGEVPSDKTVVVERFLDEIGDWRVVVMCPLGTRVIAPWAIAVAAKLREEYVDVDMHYTDDGMAFRIPACEEPPRADLFLPPADAIESLVSGALEGTALFAARFRECAGRALLLPRRDPRRRTPLWAQRKRSADLLAVASRHPTFPIMLETYRECLRDVFDLPGLASLLRDISTRRVRVATVDSRAPSPFAASVLFAFVANFIYEADAPLAERRAQAMSIDFDRLRELLGEREIRQLLDAETIADHERWLQRVSRPATHLDALHDLLLAIGDLSPAELRDRCSPHDRADEWTRDLLSAGRVARVLIAGEERIAAVEDVAKLRDALGIEVPPHVPAALRAPTSHPVRELVLRYARTHTPFVSGAIEARFGLSPGAVRAAADDLISLGRLVEGAFLPDGTEREICERDVLDALRRKSLAKLRRAVEPVDTRTLSRFVIEWQGVTRRRRGRDALLAVIGELRGCPLVASTLENAILPTRIEAYRPWDLDALCASGEVVWAGIESLGANDGRIALYRAEDEPLLERPAGEVSGNIASAIRDVLARSGAVFFAEIARQVGGYPPEVLETLWEMVWAGEVTNDTLEPLRSRARAAAASSSSSRSRGRRTHASAAPGADTWVSKRASRAAPPGAEGRWSLRSTRTGKAPSETDRKAALARALLDRYGVVTRETAHAEGIAGGFAGVYDVLKALEDQGRVRRGYFVEGHGGAQFAQPGADERLRGLRNTDESTQPIVLAATDPANVWGALLDWPASRGEARPQRTAGALVVLRDGALLAWLGRAGHALLTFELEDGGPTSPLASSRSTSPPASSRSTSPPASSRSTAADIAKALVGLVDRGERRALLVATVDGVEPSASPLLPAFIEAGFAATGRGLLKRRSPAKAGEVELAS